MFTNLNRELSEMSTEELIDLEKDLKIIWQMRIEEGGDRVPVEHQIIEVRQEIKKRASE